MKNSEAKIRILVKYCGGCNPFYDRVGLVEKIAAALRGKAQLVYSESEGLDMVLAVQGCETACTDLSLYQGLEILSITTPEEGDKFIEKINQKIGGIKMTPT
ncbi:MAG TPA: hypothetical protein ENN08_05675 [Bacteroidales bacterium]|nr:hypothetical protein [Bacteroidales bacterium]